MNNAVIIYASTHHGSTRRLAEAISAQCGMELIDAARIQQADLSGYDVIGFASGIAFGSFYPSVLQFLRDNLPSGKQVFFLYTCAKTSPRFTESIRAAAGEKGSVLLGEYGCRGFNTYGPWKLVGGMNKGHPNTTEIRRAVHFCRSLINRR